MGRKGMLALLAVVLLLAVGYFWVNQNRSTPPALGPVALLPGLQGQLSHVQAIEVARAEQPLVRVQRSASGWQVPAKAGYPADTQALGETLTALAAARTVEARTANPAYHAQLGLAETGAIEQQAVRVRLELAGDVAPIELLVGKAGARSGQLVRRAGDDQVWLVDRDIPLPTSELTWLDRRVSHIAFAQISGLSVRYPDGDALTVYRERPEQSNLRVQKLPADHGLPYEAMANGMANVFGDLTFIDALPLAQLQFKGPALLHFELATFSGGRLEGAVYQRGEQYWLLLPGRHQLSPEALPAALNWAFQIDERRYRALSKRLQDFLPTS